MSSATTPLTTLRDIISSPPLAPVWLAGGVGERFLYSIGLMQDAVLDKIQQGMWDRMPGRGNPSSLALLSADRLIPRGLTESDDSFAARLQRAFDSWQRAGTTWSVLEQVLGYLLALTPEARTVTQNSIWDFYDEGADTNQAPQHLDGAGNWTWDTLDRLAARFAQMWWRKWLILPSVAPQAWTAPAPFVWGTAGVKWGERPQNSWGLECPADVVRSIRAIVGLFKGEHVWYRWIIVSFDGALFDQTAAAGGGVNPDGNFGRWSKIVNGQYVASRFADARYCDGIA